MPMYNHILKYLTLHSAFGFGMSVRFCFCSEIPVTSVDCLVATHYGSKPKALIPGSELFVPFWKHFNPVYWIERLQMIS